MLQQVLTIDPFHLQFLLGVAIFRPRREWQNISFCQVSKPRKANPVSKRLAKADFIAFLCPCLGTAISMLVQLDIFIYTIIIYEWGMGDNG